MSDEEHCQYSLFGPLPDLSRLREARAEYLNYALAWNTARAYKYAWESFTTWCAEYARDPLPATRQTVLDFITWCIEVKRYRLGTARIGLSAIRWYHMDARQLVPISDDVKLLLRNAARKLRERPQGKRALTPDQLRRICGFFNTDDSLMARRDHAMILLGFAAGWRRSEVVSLRLSDISFEGTRLYVQLGASKTDQDGSEGRLIAIPHGRRPTTCPVRILEHWIRVRGTWQGPLFCRFTSRGEMQRIPVSGHTMNQRLKVVLERVGVNASRFGAHSLRSGMITSAAEAGADVIPIMQRTGQKNVATVLRYVRPARAFRADPLAGVL